MKILYLVARPIEINSSSSIRNSATIKGLHDIGCEVDLMTSVPDKNHPYYDETMLVEGVKKINVSVGGGMQTIAQSSRKCKVPPKLKETIAKRMRAALVYDNLARMADAVSAVPIDMSLYDAVISSSDPKSSHLVAEKLIKTHIEFRGKWIQIWGDPFMGDISVRRSKRLERKIMLEESRLLSACDSVVYVSDITREVQKKRYPNLQGKMKYIPIPYLRCSMSAKSKSRRGAVKLAYCGDYNKEVRDIIPLVEAVRAEPLTTLTICGSGDIKLKEAKNVIVHSRLPRKSVLDIEDDADVLIHISNKHGSQIPGKIYQYCGTDKAIIFVLDGERDRIRGLFEKYNRFVFCNNSKEDIGRAIHEIKEGCRKESNTPIEDFSPSRIAKKMIIDI